MCALGPILRGKHVSLEPPRSDDLPIYCSWFADVEVTRYLLRRFVPSEKQEQEWFDRAATSDDSIMWRIVVHDETIGNTGIHRIDWQNRQGSTGMMLGDKTQWGKGYASEAVALRTEFAFHELGLERLESESFVDNVRMHRILEKNGYTKIGRKRHYMFREGAWHDLYMFEVLRDEWLAGGSDHPLTIAETDA